MAIFDIDFAFQNNFSIEDMVEQLAEYSEIHHIDNTILIVIKDELKEHLKNKTIYSDCRMTALLLNCFYYKRKSFTMMKTPESLADILLPCDKSVLYLSISNKIDNYIDLARSLDNMQGQWITKIPNEFLENVHIKNKCNTVDYYIGLTEEGIKIMNVNEWLLYYQSKIYNIINRFETSHEKYDIANNHKTACFGLLDIYKQKHGCIPCVSYYPNGTEVKTFKTVS